MSFRFRDNETFEAAFRRITKEQIAKAHKHLAFGSDSSVCVLEARKSMKRLRSLMRLYRSALGKTDYSHENARYRDIARLLSSSRDRQVMMETVAFLMRELDATERPRKLKTLTRGLADVCHCLGERNGAVELKVNGFLEEQILKRRAIAMLDDAQQELGLLRLKGHGFQVVGRGLEFSYAQGVRNFLKAKKSDTDNDDALHDWRKSIQTHWRHMALFKKAWPEFFLFRITASKQLALVLGQHQDLCLVEDFVAALPTTSLEPKRCRAVSKYISKRKKVLRARALNSGAMLFADKPKDLSRQIETYWNTWCRDSFKHHPRLVVSPRQSNKNSVKRKTNPFKLTDGL